MSLSKCGDCGAIAGTPHDGGCPSRAEPFSLAEQREQRRRRDLKRFWATLDAERESHADEVASLLDTIRELTDGAEHTRVFLTSRQKMHPTGVKLYDEAIQRARTVLAAHTEGS